jgi:hypothetical protein
MHFKPDDFLSAGFLITHRFERPAFASPDLLPTNLISASPCLADFVPDTWCLAWTGDTEEQRRQKAAIFGLSDSEREMLTALVTTRFDESWLWPNVCTSLANARGLMEVFLAPREGIVLLELGLHRIFRDAFCRAAEPRPSPPGFSPPGRQGVHEMILKDQPILATGIPLGFEPLVFDQALSCTWLCNGLETVIHQDLGLTLNEHSLIAGFEEARRGVAHIPTVVAEPGLWLPWLLLDHTPAMIGRA